MELPKLSIIVPAYNEERFIRQLLEKVIAVDLSQFNLDKEVIVVDDCSKDGTGEIIGAFPGVRLIKHKRNTGKGGAVRTGINAATGLYLIIQDADLEYDPADYQKMVAALLRNQTAAVYGSRYYKYPGYSRIVNLLTGKHKSQSWLAYLGGQSLSFAACICTGHYLSDTVTALKLFRREVIVSLDLQSNGFELDHEITAKVFALGGQIEEIPISYFPRSKRDGKKIGLKDWFIAIKTFYRYRNG
ncbi:MAG TPA: glycosyltransferase family 2 protein [Pyrinomonadaceae bacterium]|nr:glycosyltransferase family 2 protein [Pyrinomonadaceae bacterium]HRK50923.1 glycosyltransferase family 2 protein [Pyrinomonadaceae bacterium]